MTMPGLAAIDRFAGEHRWLSNFYPVWIDAQDGLRYPSVEHGYVAAKTLDMAKRREISAITTAGNVKRLGRSLDIREDWGAVKLEVMLDLLRLKFKDPILAYRLRTTGQVTLVEGNYWGDTFWGVCEGKGANHLGRLLMQVRSEILRS